MREQCWAVQDSFDILTTCAKTQAHSAMLRIFQTTNTHEHWRVPLMVPFNVRPAQGRGYPGGFGLWETTASLQQYLLVELDELSVSSIAGHLSAPAGCCCDLPLGSGNSLRHCGRSSHGAWKTETHVYTSTHGLVDAVLFSSFVFYLCETKSAVYTGLVITRAFLSFYSFSV